MENKKEGWRKMEERGRKVLRGRNEEATFTRRWRNKKKAT